MKNHFKLPWIVLTLISILLSATLVLSAEMPPLPSVPVEEIKNQQPQQQLLRQRTQQPQLPPLPSVPVEEIKNQQPQPQPLRQRIQQPQLQASDETTQTKGYIFNKPLNRTIPYVVSEPGSVKALLNMKRPSYGLPAGWMCRSGTTRHNDTQIGTGVSGMWSYTNSDFGTNNLIIQTEGQLYLATAYPPDNSDTFGTSLATLQSGLSTGFGDKIGNDFIFVASGETPWAYSGPAYPDAVLIDYNGGNTVYQDGWSKVRNDLPESYITWLQADSSSQTAYIGFRRRINSIYLNFGTTVNTVTGGASVFARNGGQWVEVSGLSDNTQNDDKCFTQDGAMTWTYSANDEPYLLPGTADHLFWYAISSPIDLTDGVHLNQLYITDVCQPITQLWSGYWDFPIGVKRYTSSVTFEDYTYEVTNGSVYSYMDIGAGITEFYVGFASPVFALNIKINKDNTNETSAISPYVLYWDGTSLTWTIAGTITDGTAKTTGGAPYFGAHSGVIQWDGTSFEEDSRQLEGDSLSKFWYKIYLSSAMPSGTTVSIYEISGAKKPELIIPVKHYNGVCHYNGRAAYWPGQYHKNSIDFSMDNKPWILNGPQAGSTGGIFGPGEVNAMTELHSYGIVSTKKPYRLYLLEGKVPGKFDELMISKNVGVLAPHTLVTVEDAVRIFNTTRNVHAVMFLAPDGIYMTDGQTVMSISQPISDYWDKTSPPYIDSEFASESWAWVDYSEKLVYFCVPISNDGTAQTKNNYVLPYNYVTGEWYDRWDFSANPSCGVSLIGHDNEQYSLYANYNGGIIRMNHSGASDFDTPIPQAVITNDFNPFNELTKSFELKKVAIKAKSQAAGFINLLMYPDDATTAVLPSGETAFPLAKSGYGYTNQKRGALNVQGTIAESMAFTFYSGMSNHEIMEIYGYTVEVQPVRESWE